MEIKNLLVKIFFVLILLFLFISCTYKQQTNSVIIAKYHYHQDAYTTYIKSENALIPIHHSEKDSYYLSAIVEYDVYKDKKKTRFVKHKRVIVRDFERIPKSQYDSLNFPTFDDWVMEHK